MMTTEKTVKYTDEQTAAAVQAYQAGSTVEAIAESLGKSVRSVVAKLSREGVYVAKAKAAGAGRVTKSDLVARIAAKLGVEVEKLESLEKASKEALVLLAA